MGCSTNKHVKVPKICSDLSIFFMELCLISFLLEYKVLIKLRYNYGFPVALNQGKIEKESLSIFLTVLAFFV